jgi:hypothetical protein
VPGARPWAFAGLVLIAAAWFIVPALTSASALRPGDLALNQHTVIHGNKVVGVIQRLRSLYELPMQIAAVLGVIAAAVRRDVETLGLVACALLWVIVEIAFAYHGWSAVARYLLEPGAVMIVVAGAFVGRVLAETADRSAAVALAGPALVIVLLATLVPAVHRRGQTWHAQIVKAEKDARWINVLPGVIARAGGTAAIRRCGQLVSYNRVQSTIAWAMGLNVSAVDYDVPKVISEGRPVVVIVPRARVVGWQVRAYNETGAAAAACARVRLDTGAS